MRRSDRSMLSQRESTGRKEGEPEAEMRMRAVRIVAPRRAETLQVPLPRPGPNEVRVRLEGCGVCGSNLPVWQGRPWFEYPLPPGAPGHEGWGVIDGVGKDVVSAAPGDRVAFLSGHAYAEYDIAQGSEIVAAPARPWQSSASALSAPSSPSSRRAPARSSSRCRGGLSRWTSRGAPGLWRRSASKAPTRLPSSWPLPPAKAPTA